METTNNNGNKSLKIILGFVAILFVILLFKGCFDHKEKVTIVVPEIKGSTSIAKPQQEKIIYKDKIVFKYLDKDNPYWKNEAKRLLTEYNSQTEAFANANDSLQQLLYSKAIEPKEFFNEWDNDTINATVFGMNKGEIQSIQLKYTIKERKHEIKVPTTVLRLLGGIETGATKDLSKFNIKASVGIQNAKGNILSAGLDSEQIIYIGYSMSIFSIKR